MSEQGQLFNFDEHAIPNEPPAAPTSDDRPARPEPKDQAQRNQIAISIDETLFVEAGAGSGKTTALVNRVISLIQSGIGVENIAAITFTEKAAAELRDRIRSVLADRAAKAESGDDRAQLEDALDNLDGAAISTLHAFAQRVLSEHPVEAQLPPAVEVADEISSTVAFDERWTQFIDQLLDTPESARDFLIGSAVGMSLDHLRQVARQFNNNWDLVAEQVPEPADDHIELDLESVIRQLEATTALREFANDPTDKLAVRLGELHEWALSIRRSADDIETLERLANPPVTLKSGMGRKDSWNDPAWPIDMVKKSLDDTRHAIEAEFATIADAALTSLSSRLASWTLDAAEDRRLEGRLEYHDLLVRARQVLRNTEFGPSVRESLRSRYQRLLLDEFQDTDPIQVELATLIASPDTDGTKPWHELTVPPGSLFFVGDPKQSIYRFRRADINLFLEARTTYSDAPVQLSTNFRTTVPIISWINHVFGRLITFREGSQPHYEPLDPVRAAAPKGHAVTVIGKQHEKNVKADELRRREASDVANTICLAMQEGWEVHDKEAGPDAQGRDQWRPAKLGDFTILIPARTSLSALEFALDQAGVPYRAESSSLVYTTPEIRDVLAVLRSIADPTDELALSTALRSSVFGCGDDDLYTFKLDHRGIWNHQADLPETLPADHPVGEAITFLCELSRAQMWLSPSELIERVVRERLLLELAFTDRRPRDLWRRFRFLIDQARAYAESEGGGLREYLKWAELQSSEGARVSESVLPETDDDSVRIMTIHGSKGLEFPITILSGLTTEAARKNNGVQVLFPHEGPCVIKIRKDLESLDFQRHMVIDEQMGFHEALRLLYVAATRARDHLVVSMHHKTPGTPKTAVERFTMAELIGCALEDAPRFELLDFNTTGAVDSPPIDAADPLLAKDQWEAERDHALTTGSRRRVLAATTIAQLASNTEQQRIALDDDPARDPGLQKQGRNLDLPPWQKGRYGTAIGRAVHGTLQTVDLVTGDGLAETAAAQSAAEGVGRQQSVVEALAGSALQTSVVTEAISGEYWREMYVAAPLSDDLVLEGYIDLLYRTADGLVVVDYKTDAVPDDATLEAKLARYRLQGATYALAVEEATGETVTRVVFAFLAEDGSIERDVADLRGAIDEVRATAVHAATAAPGSVGATSTVANIE